jgi:hypothetical protein
MRQLTYRASLLQEGFVTQQCPQDRENNHTAAKQENLPEVIMRNCLINELTQMYRLSVLKQFPISQLYDGNVFCSSTLSNIRSSKRCKSVCSC